MTTLERRRLCAIDFADDAGHHHLRNCPCFSPLTLRIWGLFSGLSSLAFVIPLASVVSIALALLPPKAMTAHSPVSRSSTMNSLPVDMAAG
jgi:hypothetical protein